MGIPTGSSYQKDTGRFWDVSFQIKWDATDDQNLVATKVADLDALSSGYYAGNTARFAVKRIEWNSNLTGSVDLFFDSMPGDTSADVISIGTGASQGEVDFSKDVDGARVDPGRNAPGNLVASSSGAASGDELWLRVSGYVKGTTI